MKAYVAPVQGELPLSFEAQTVSPTGTFATLEPPNQSGQLTQVFVVNPGANGVDVLTTNQLIVFVANPGIGLAGTELSQFGSRDFILPLRVEPPYTPVPTTTVLANAATLGANETSPAGAIGGREEIFKIRRILDENALQEKLTQGESDTRNPEIRPEWLGIEEGQLNDLEVIRRSFLRLPDGRYQVTQQRGEGGQERVILDIQLKQGIPTPYEDLAKPQLEGETSRSLDDGSQEDPPPEAPPQTSADRTRETNHSRQAVAAATGRTSRPADPQAEIAMALFRTRLQEQRRRGSRGDTILE